MNHDEAIQWLLGNRSLTNSIPQEPRETWIVRIEQADLAKTQQAYWIAKAYAENLIQDQKESK